MSVTMRDVAALAGVSLKTVSRVVNHEPHIRAETQERVRGAIAELGWTPNASARTLRTGRTGVVGIAVASLRRPLLAALVETLVTEVDRHGLHAAVEPTRDDPGRFGDVVAQVGRTFDAVLALDAPAVPPADGAVVVRVDVSPRRRAEPDGDDRVHADAGQAADLILRHLALMGRSRVVQLGAGALVGTDLPLIPVDDRVETDHAGRAAGYRAARRVLDEHPETDALVCATDEIALGALAGLHDAGAAVPGRVAVVGYGALDDGWFATPSLTTVDLDLDRLGRTAVDAVVARLSGADSGAPRTVAVPVTLVRRESTLGTSVQ